MLIVSMGLAALLWSMGSISNRRSMSVLAMSAPDQMLLLSINIVLALVTCIVQLISLIQLNRASTSLA